MIQLLPTLGASGISRATLIQRLLASSKIAFITKVNHCETGASGAFELPATNLKPIGFLCSFTLM
jgi:hypothetical protein